MVTVSPRARTGSPRDESCWKGDRKGMIPSLEMACRSLGAPVRDWRPAPMVESREPTSTTFGWGQAMLPTTRDPPILSPNLKRREYIFEFHRAKSGNGESTKFRTEAVLVFGDIIPRNRLGEEE